MNRHPVINHLMARSGKKPPFNDGRQIALVLPGGIMLAVHGAGGVTSFSDMGFSQAFDYILTGSAGFPNASYLLSENPTLGATIYHEELSGKKFINPYRFWKPINIEKVIEAISTIKSVDVQKIWESNTKVHLRLREMRTKTAVYLPVQEFPQSTYFDFLRAAISFPILTSGAVINGQRYTDGQITKGDFKQLLLDVTGTSLYTDIIILYNSPAQRVIDFASSERILEIIPRNPVRWYETRSEILKAGCDASYNQILELFR